MNTYTIYLNGDPITDATDTNSAYECFEVAKAAAEMTGGNASLVWDDTGEIVAYIDFTEEDEDDYYEGDDCDYEVGYDPYMGCYTDDC